MADTAIPEMPKIDLSATMRQLLDQHRALLQYIENVGEARKRLKEIERTLAYLNSVTSQPVTMPQQAANKTGGKRGEYRGNRTKRVDILWKWNNRRGSYECMVPDCRTAATSSSSMSGHFQRNHPAEYEQNTLSPK